MSTSRLPIDFSELKFSVTTDEQDDDSEEEFTEYGDLYAFTKEYNFEINDPNPPPPVVEEDHDPQGPPYLRRFRDTYIEPLVKIQVRTINRAKILPGAFYLYMDEICEDFLQFSMGVFNKNGRIKLALYQPRSPERGTGVWGSEINQGILAYIEQIQVSSRYQRQGIGRWAIENLLNGDTLAHCPFFFLMPGVINTDSPFGPPDPNFESKKLGIVSFWRSVGFRRVAGTYIFGYARDPSHLMRSLNAEDDADERKNLRDFTPMDVQNY